MGEGYRLKMEVTLIAHTHNDQQKFLDVYMMNTYDGFLFSLYVRCYILMLKNVINVLGIGIMYAVPCTRDITKK